MRQPDFHLRDSITVAGRLVREWLIGVAFAVAVIAIPSFDILPLGRVTLEEGDVAAQDVHSPRHATFASDILTESARERAEANVEPIYTPPDGRVARQQIAFARKVAEYIRSIRADTTTTLADKYGKLTSLIGLSLSPTLAQDIIQLSDDDWDKIEAEMLATLDWAMRSEIREDNLYQARARVPALVSTALTEQQAAIAGELAQQFIVPNSFLDTRAAEAARATARQSVEPVMRSFEAGEIVVREGQIVRALDVEALDDLGLRQARPNWGNWAGAVLYAVIVVIPLGLYLQRFERSRWNHPRKLIVLAVLILLFVLAAKVMLPHDTILPYLFPAATLPMLLVVLVSPNLAVLATAVLAILASVVGGGAELIVFVAAGGFVAALTLGRIERLSGFFRVGLYVTVVNVIVLLAFRLPAGNTDASSMLTLLASAIANGSIATSLSFGGLFILGNLGEITTTIQLQELARPTHPLQQLLLEKAPGTYHHTRMVANLAEHAAEHLGADALLVRVGALYHDIGKSEQPYMFVENQRDGVNVHDKLDPRTSAEIIMQHVKEGVTLARRYRLPGRVRDFIPEHHGTMRASFLYQRAVQQAGGDAAQVNEKDFRYPGPKPQSKETALVMLADGCEAATRAIRPSSTQEIDDIVRKIISDRVA